MTTAPQLHPNLRNINETLRWCYDPHPQATVLDMANVEEWVADLTRDYAEKASEAAAKGQWDRVRALSSNVCDFARAIAVIQLQIHRKRNAA